MMISWPDAFDYTSPSAIVVVRSYTVPTINLPVSGAVRFSVIVRAPDMTTRTITSSPFGVVATPTSCSIGTLVGSEYACVDGSTVPVPFTLSTVANTAFGKGLAVLGSVDSVSAPSVVFGAYGTFSSASYHPCDVYGCNREHRRHAGHGEDACTCHNDHPSRLTSSHRSFPTRYQRRSL